MFSLPVLILILTFDLFPKCGPLDASGQLNKYVMLKQLVRNGQNNYCIMNLLLFCNQYCQNILLHQNIQRLSPGFHMPAPRNSALSHLFTVLM